MKKLFIIISSVLLVLANYSVNAQASVLNPADADMIFTSTNQPAVPAWGQISKWGHTARLDWNPYSYGYKSYYFEGMAFRIVFPKSYKQGVVDGKKYPMLLFYHGIGESGNVWDNEYQLFHGGQFFAQSVIDSTFDGYILVPQSQSGYMQSYFSSIASLEDTLVKYNKLDIDRITINGLSGGGQATWDFLSNQAYAQRTCATMPMSAADYDQEKYYASYITVPIWTANGGQDVAPYPSTVTDIINYYKSLGGNIIQSFYLNDGHDSWDDFWNEPNFWTWVKAQHKANPLVYFQHSSFCPAATVSAKLGVQSGFYAYQWQKNGVTIAGSTADSLNITAYGTYACRYERTATSGWSVWSPAPVVISQMQPTVTPPIQINGLHSNVLPAPDGSTTVPLMVPNTYASYEWHRVNGTDSIVSTANTFNAPVGLYKVRVTQLFGCSSNFSPNDTVIAANGTKIPPPATNGSALALSSSSVEFDWNVNPSPLYSQTAFEVYRTTTSGSNYTLLAITGANASTYVDKGLLPNIKYYYIVRAINSNGASAVTAEASAVTLSDVTPPSVPTNLTVTGTTRSSVSLSWNASTDDVGVYKYDIYINGVKSYSTSNTTFTINNLTALQTYSFFVKARDASGNVSPASTQVTASAALSGLTYTYYQGTWSVLPDFTQQTPLATGVVPNVDLTHALASVDYGFLWQGYIIIPKSGSYTFETSSDDGSDLYIGTYSPTATPLVNNDGLHGTQSATGTITLTAGIHPIAITYFQNGGGAAMNIYWTSTANGIARQLIPNSAFSDVVTPGAVPAKPSFLSVTANSYNRTTLSWTDNSTNETGFELSRATSKTGTYQALGTTAAGVTSFVDSLGLTPNTKYWYKIRAVNANGGSGYVSTLEGSWAFNNDYTDASGNNNSLTASGSPTFSTDSKEGGVSLSLNGTSQYADMTFSASGAFPSNSYTTRTVAAWIKPTAATISAANKIVYDLGGADNGISLRFNSGALQAGIAGNNVRSTVVVNNIATNANWVSGGWNHVAVVYNVNTIQLFVNGVLAGTTSLTFSTLGTSTTGSRIGASNGSNAFNSATTSTNYGGLIDDIEIITEPVNAAGVTALMNQSYTADTTLVLPAVPAAPSNLTAQAISPSSVLLSFKDNASNETSFQVYRALISDANFRLQATISPGAGTGSLISYTDTGLFANTNYYYKVLATGVGGNSAFTSPDPLITTLNTRPVVTKVSNFSMRYDAQVTVPVSATDADGDAVTFTVLNAPSFGTFTNSGGNAATLLLNPGVTGNQGSYVVSIIAQDTHSGKDTTTFTVTVNSNYTPVPAAIGTKSINEGDSVVVPLTATDQDGNGTLVWTITSAPSFVTIGSTTNGVANLTLKPGYAAAGTYSVTAAVSDGAGGLASVTFSLVVGNKNPPSETVYMDLRGGSANAPAPWNNITGLSTANLLNSTGTATAVGLQFLNNIPWDVFNAGAVTGNNSGVYPDAAMSDYLYFGIYGAPATESFNLTGLATSAKYNVTLFGSSTYSGAGTNGTTVYTINGIAKPLNIANNTQNTVVFSGVSPDASGNITVNLSVTAGTPYGVINTIVLDRPFNDGTKPVLPANLSAQVLPSGYIKLAWTDAAYNEANDSIYRSTSATGPFTVLSRAANANDSTYTDSTVLSSTTYYYEIAATNANGSSGLTGAASATTLNKAPVLSALGDIYAKTGTINTVNVTATDDPGHIITTTVSNLPSFAAYQSTGNGTGKIVFTITPDNIGVYKNILVTVTNNFGAATSASFSLHVTDSSLRSVYVNFGGPSATPQPAPWNNYFTYPFANNPLTNLTDDANTNSGFSVKLLDQWDGNYAFGMPTGNNSGVFPDNVMTSSFYTGNTNTHTIEVDGLNPSKKYDLGFLSTFNSGDTSLATFANGTQSVTVDARYNTTTLAQLNGLTPSASGAIQVTITKNSRALYLSLNAMVIQEYLSSTPIVSPYNLFAATVLDTSSIQLTWSDKSSNETGFQIYRATSVNGAYTLVTTTAANVTTYTNTGLKPDTRYYYKVRAINGAVNSNYSNIATATLAANVVLINMTDDATRNGASPWNNTNFISNAGATISNLINTATINTGYEMEITKAFQNIGFDGSAKPGIFPVGVMLSDYWMDASTQSEVLFDNLDVRKKYRIGCFSSNASVNFTSANFSCNGQSVILNSYDNNSKVVYLDKLVPNADGQLYVDANTVAGSPYSFVNAFTLESFDDTDTYVAPLLNRPAEEQQPTVPVATTNINIKVYPNPFVNRFTVELNDTKPAAVALSLYDANARLVYSGTATKQEGSQLLDVKLANASHLPTGTYFLNVILDGKISKSVTLLKVN